MLFNSLQFVFFLPVVVALFFLTPHRLRWVLLLAASYYFYMCWKPAYAILLVVSTVVDYVCALGLENARRTWLRWSLLATSLAVNLGLLFVFKYYQLFAVTTNELLGLASTPAAIPLLDLLLPVGISFYTFQTLSYTIDVFRRQRPAERHFGLFALYVSFFPQLVAGPIERSDNLLPQFRQQQRFSPVNIEDGLKLVLWGYFKKLVIADRLAVYVDQVYSASEVASSGQLMLATYLFAFQIYCDFSGYTDIAIGAAQMMGYTFRPNFRSPYLAQNIQDFWSRWHISLSTWFRDYVYVPLGGSAVAASRWAFNIAVVFLISGLWHGANWTFVVWGGLHAAYYLIYRGYRRMRSGRRSASLASGSVSHALSVAVTFHAVLVAWVFFRAASLAAAVGILTRMLPGGWRTAPADIVGFGRFDLIVGVMAIAFLMTVEILQGHDLRQFLAQRPRPMRWGFYYAVVLLIVNFGMFHNPQQFIYFQF